MCIDCILFLVGLEAKKSFQKSDMLMKAQRLCPPVVRESKEHPERENSRGQRQGGVEKRSPSYGDVSEHMETKTRLENHQRPEYRGT